MGKCGLVAMFFLTGSPVTAARAEEPLIKLYCAAKVVTVDERSWADMKKALGPDVCTFGEFSSKAAAENHSIVFGGVGAKCSCK